jgi:hypothetical protein
MERDLSQEAAERLLSGDLTPPPDGTDRLAALLAAASAPGRPDELAGEAAAMAAFRAHPPTIRRWSLRRALTIKVAAAVAVMVAAGGVAVASGTGFLPIPFIPGKAGPVPSGTDGPAGRSPGQGRTASPAPSPADPALPGLCADFQKKTSDEKQKELKGKHFEQLVKAAGGPEHVEGFCAQVLAATPNPGKGKSGENPGSGTPGSPATGNGPGADPTRPGVPPTPATGPPAPPAPHVKTSTR